MIETCPEYGDCDFDENNICQWTAVKENTTFSWTINARNTQTQSRFQIIWNIQKRISSFIIYKYKDTGPAFDHTLGTSTGRYIYIETSFPAKKGDIARIKSPNLESTVCFEFWYHMYGM